MSLVYLLLSVYLIALIVVIHCSLLFCTGKHCLFNFGKSFLPTQIQSMLFQILKIIPLPLQTIQAIANLLLIGDVVFILIVALNFLKSIIKYVCYTLLIMAVVLLTLYSITEYLKQHQHFRIQQYLYNLINDGSKIMAGIIASAKELIGGESNEGTR